MNHVWESRFGSLVSAAGSIWLVYEATNHLNSFSTLLLPQGPLELCGLGILTWLHAKYRATLAASAAEPSTQE